MARRKDSTGKKAIRGQVAQRVHEVKLLILSGATRYDILQYAANESWDLKERQVDDYMAKASNAISDSLKPEAAQALELALALARRQMLYARALEQGDVKAALAVLKDEAELRGLYAPTKIAPTSPDGSQSYDPTAGLAALLPELQAAVDRLGQEAGGPAGDGPAPSGPPADGPDPLIHPGPDDA
jgi:hypothetical protein